MGARSVPGTRSGADSEAASVSTGGNFEALDVAAVPSNCVSNPVELKVSGNVVALTNGEDVVR